MLGWSLSNLLGYLNPLRLRKTADTEEEEVEDGVVEDSADEQGPIAAPAAETLSIRGHEVCSYGTFGQRLC